MPLSVPLEPDWIDSQLPPEITEAVQLMVPVPVLATENVVVPDEDATSRLLGVTESSGSVSTA